MYNNTREALVNEGVQVIHNITPGRVVSIEGPEVMSTP